MLVSVLFICVFYRLLSCVVGVMMLSDIVIVIVMYSSELVLMMSFIMG